MFGNSFFNVGYDAYDVFSQMDIYVACIYLFLLLLYAHRVWISILGNASYASFRPPLLWSPSQFYPVKESSVRCAPRLPAQALDTL